MSDDKRYYPVDAYYSYKEDTLYYIVKEVDLATGKVRKLSSVKKKPNVNIRTADNTEKVSYLVDRNTTEEMTLPYKEYGIMKKALEKIYSGKKYKRPKIYSKYKSLFLLNKEIYDDYKVETQFLQQDIFLYDENYINNINVGFWDIEVLTDGSEFPHPEQAKYPINAIALYKKFTNTVNFYCLLDNTRHTNPSDIMDRLTSKFNDHYGKDTYKLEMSFFATEEELLIQFLKDIKEIDVLVGWNSLNFDTHYISTRTTNLNIHKYFKLSFGEMFETLNVVDSKQGMMATTFYTTKILSLDYITLIKFYSMKNYPSHSLDFIASKILKGEEDSLTAKVKVPNLNKEYFNDLANFALYNINDVILNKRIDDKMLFITLLFKQKILTRGFTASLLSINNILDSYIGLKANENGLSCISKIKTTTYYRRKIWYIYRRVNALTNDRIRLINKLREENKGFAILTSADEITDSDDGLSEEIYASEGEIPDEFKLTKLQIPFAWNEDKYPGAYVKIPKKGIYLNVVDFDATSMYPTSIYTTNNSIDTWIYQVPENIALKYIYEREDLINYIKNNDISLEVYDVRADNFKRFTGQEILTLFETIYEKELVLTESGAVFMPAHIKEGFFRKLIAEPISNRQATKRKMKKLKEEGGFGADHPDIINLNVTQLVLKIIANSVYGYLGFRNSRLFNIILATTITINCQFMIRYVAYLCEGIINDVQNGEKGD
jgi:DNA polymerase elongation subunit (family B)